MTLENISGSRLPLGHAREHPFEVHRYTGVQFLKVIPEENSIINIYQMELLITFPNRKISLKLQHFSYCNFSADFFFFPTVEMKETIHHPLIT